MTPDDFDLDGEWGVVQLGDGRSIVLGPQAWVGVDGCGGVKYIRKGVYLSKTTPAGRLRRSETGLSPPPIIVDAYE